MKHRPGPLRRIALLLCLPLLLLAAAGVWVVMAERARVEADVRAEARRRLDGLLAELPQEVIPRKHKPGGSDLQNDLTYRGYFVGRWLIQGMDPPAPGKGWAGYERWRQLIREGKKEEASRVEDRDSALSREFTPSGTPLVPLRFRATLDLVEPDRREVMARSVCNAAVEFPSVLSGRLVRDGLQFLPGAEHQEWLDKAIKAEELLTCIAEITKRQNAAGRLPSRRDGAGDIAVLPVSGEWTDCGLVRHYDSTFVQIIPWQQLHDLMQPLVQRHSGEAAGLFRLDPQIAWHNGVIQPARGLELATATKGAWRVWMFTPSLEALAAETTRRTQRSAWLLGNAMLATAFAMWMTFRAFKKQAELSRLQSEFVASVSHELRTPVASIGALAERLESGKAGAEQTAEYHRFIAREGRRLASLVDNVLDFSRIERGSRAYDFDHADLPRLIRETAALLRPAAEERGLTLTEEIHEVPESLWPPVDAVALRQALVNLLDNAIKFTPSGGTVTVKFSAVDRAVCIHVSDTGIGIPAGEQARIFDRFYRVDNGLRRETTGAGIGLSLVKHIVEAHGARVTVTSEPGDGSGFTLRFPPPPNRKS